MEFICRRLRATWRMIRVVLKIRAVEKQKVEKEEEKTKEVKESKVDEKPQRKLTLNEMPSTSRGFQGTCYKQKDYRKGVRARRKRNKKRTKLKRRAAQRRVKKNYGLNNIRIKL